VKLERGDRLYEGDRVMFARTATIGVNNGDLGTVLKIDQVRQKLTVRFDDRKKPVTISTKYYKDLALGYAVTTHRAQGVTTENAFVLLGGGMQDKETTFVQLSRARGTTRLFTDRLEAGPKLENLVKQVEKSRAKNLAHDVMEQSQQQALVQQIQV
jgi:ATP-dependent exoDNAse (exonuclease V) alpha subunit